MGNYTCSRGDIWLSQNMFNFTLSGHDHCKISTWQFDRTDNYMLQSPSLLLIADLSHRWVIFTPILIFVDVLLMTARDACATCMLHDNAHQYELNGTIRSWPNFLQIRAKNYICSSASRTIVLSLIGGISNPGSSYSDYSSKSHVDKLLVKLWYAFYSTKHSSGQLQCSWPWAKAKWTLPKVPMPRHPPMYF